jgi:hypothetical protein
MAAFEDKTEASNYNHATPAIEINGTHIQRNQWRYPQKSTA